MMSDQRPDYDSEWRTDPRPACPACGREMAAIRNPLTGALMDYGCYQCPKRRYPLHSHSEGDCFDPSCTGKAPEPAPADEILSQRIDAMIQAVYPPLAPPETEPTHQHTMAVVNGQVRCTGCPFAAQDEAEPTHGDCPHGDIP